MNILFFSSNNSIGARLTEDQLKAFRSEKTVRIKVDQTYGKAEGVSLPFESISKRLFQYAGIEVKRANSENYQSNLLLWIQANGEAFGANYGSPTYPAICYVGASLSGTISFIIPNSPPYTHSFEATKNPSPRIYIYGIDSHQFIKKYSSPSSAPFYSVFLQSKFIYKLLEMMKEIYGPNFLLMALNDNDLEVQRSVAHSLWDIYITESWAIEPLINALKVDDQIIQNYASNALAKIGEPAIEQLIASFKEENSAITRYATRALTQIGTPAIEPLIDSLKNNHWRIRSCAAGALGDIGNSRAVIPLINALREKHIGVKKSVIVALKKIKDSRAIYPLILVLEDEDKIVRFSTNLALVEITGEDFGQNQTKWIEWWERNKKKFIHSF